MTTTPMNMNELLDQLKRSKDNVADFVIHNLNDKTGHVLQLLERCDIDTLNELKQYMMNDQKHLCHIMRERRMNYVNRVRRQYQAEMRKNKKNGMKNEKIQEDNFIDFSEDPDDSHNLSYGVSLISSRIDDISKIIKRKQNELEEIQKRNHPFNTLMSYIFQ